MQICVHLTDLSTDCRQELQRRYERVLLLDIDVANQRGVEQQLWRSVYYNVIEGLRRQQGPEDSAATTSNNQALNEILTEVGTGDGNEVRVMGYWNFSCIRFIDPVYR